MAAKDKGKGRNAVTLRFSNQDMEIMKAVFMRLAGHDDIKKGCKDIIVNVMNNAVKEIQEQVKQQAESQEAKARNEQDERDTPGDSEEAQQLTSDDSTEQKRDEDSVADSEGSAGASKG